MFYYEIGKFLKHRFKKEGEREKNILKFFF